MRVGMFSPSWKRGKEKSLTQRYCPAVRLVVAESQAKEYIASGNDVIICPDEAQGNLCRVRNWILDELAPDLDGVVILDDDISGVCYYEVERGVGCQKIKLSGYELEEFVEMGSILCKEIGARFWGLNPAGDKGGYREHTPFSLSKYVPGPFQGFLSGQVCRYDEELPLKEDYDMTLQQLHKYGKVLRFNAYHMEVKQSEQEGGCADYRTLRKEKEQFEGLRRKWGKEIVRMDVGSKREFDYNPIIKPPILGV